MTPALDIIKPVRTDDFVFPLSVDQYHEMIRTGVLKDDDPVELLEGVLVFHIPKNPPHRFVTRAVFDVLSKILPQDWHCQMQEPVTLADGEPEPDLSIVRGRPEDFRTRHPGATDIAIVIEVADSTLDRDRGAKYRGYARAGIFEYWIIDLVNRCVDVFRRPIGAGEPPRYEQCSRFTADQKLPVEIGGLPIGNLDLDNLFS